MLTAKAPKPKKCRAASCGIVFTPARPLQRVCSGACAALVARSKREQDERAEKRRKAAQTRKELDAIKTVNQLLAEAQPEFNRYIRFRDILAGRNCIDCDKPFEPEKLGGSMDAGHYLSVGSTSHLRFDERNVHAQRKNCNRPGGTTRSAFRLGMIARVGLEVVLELEANHQVHHWTREEVREIRDTYRALANALAKQIQQRAPT